jgi:pyruvate/2-oxoglutarate dehydrogenase complex dihydrolipoamide acyltransferase (E2) component
MYYDVCVRDDYRYNHARVGGREFNKAQATRLAEHEMTPEIRRSPLLEVQEVTPVGERVVDATNAARVLAAELGVDLASIEGTGEEGRIIKADVERVAGLASEGAGDDQD